MVLERIIDINFINTKLFINNTFSKLLLNFPYFKGLIQTKPSEVPQPIGVSKYIFWSLFFLSGLIACFSFIPMSELSKMFFSDASNRIQTWFFPQRMNNAIMLWAIFNGLIGLLLFFGETIFYFQREE